MRQLLVIGLGLLMSACAHEQIQIDRELALKLADKPAVQVVQAPPQTINVNVNTVPTQASAPYRDGSVDDRKNCTTSPVYKVTGELDHLEKSCYGTN